MTHLAGWFVPVLSSLALLLAAPTAAAPHHTGGDRVLGYGQILYDGHGPEWWANRSRAWHQQARGLRRELMSRGSVQEALSLACSIYGYCDTLWRKARCESGLSSSARNPSGASGLFQFLPSTWATTPFARLSIWSPYASALAAGWMHQRGRGGEWVCR
jgi:hypothetical protein